MFFYARHPPFFHGSSSMFSSRCYCISVFTTGMVFSVVTVVLCPISTLRSFGSRLSLRYLCPKVRRHFRKSNVMQHSSSTSFFNTPEIIGGHISVTDVMTETKQKISPNGETNTSEERA
jgi:hypothetical protein